MGAVRPHHGIALAYLDPPPFPAPVVVMKDVGGFVSEYQAQTARFRQEGREVRLHECRSACTLALSLPNVCVYPSSLLKFHKAYNANTRAVDEGVSSELFRSYPAAVQARLGVLTREYKVLTGRELIALGMRECGQGGGTQVARAGKQPPAPAAAAPTERGLFSTLSAAFSPKAVDPTPVGTLRALPGQGGHGSLAGGRDGGHSPATAPAGGDQTHAGPRPAHAHHRRPAGARLRVKGDDGALQLSKAGLNVVAQHGIDLVVPALAVEDAIVADARLHVV